MHARRGGMGRPGSFPGLLMVRPATSRLPHADQLL